MKFEKVRLRKNSIMAGELAHACVIYCTRLNSGERVPRYFFHVHDGQSLIDEDGLDLVDDAAARREAVAAAGRMLSESMECWENDLLWTMHVVNSDGLTIGSLSFAAKSLRF